MNNLQQLLYYIIIGIDRLEFSVPLKYYKQLFDGMNLYCTFVKEYPKKGYNRTIFKHLNKRIIIKIKEEIKEQITNQDKINFSQNTFKERMYITVCDPDAVTQNFISFLFETISYGNTNDFYNILLKQIEISYDFYPTEGTDINKLEHYIKKHFFIKYTRASSYFTFKTTLYTGRDGIIHDGAKGTRRYKKSENGKTFMRFEIQYNRDFINEKKIEYTSLPLNPLSFHSLNYVDILGDFTMKGIKNVARSILKKQGIISSQPEFKTLHREMMKKVHLEVLGGSRGTTKYISSQINALKNLKKEYQFTINRKDVFPVLSYTKQLISCLADVGYSEKNISKRMVLCQGIDVDQ